MNKKKGFTLIEVMIVVAIVAILAMTAVSQYMLYIDRARDSSTQALLHSLSLSQMSLRTVPGNDEFIAITGPADIPNIAVLAEFGFRPDPTVGFAAVPFAGEPDGNYVLFAAYGAANSKIYVYNFSPRAGVRPFDPAESYAAIMPATFTAYTWHGATATAAATLAVNPGTGLVSSVGP